MKKLILIITTILLINCSTETPTQFSDKALNDTFTSINNTELTFKEIITKYKGKKIVIDIWASWCGDCIKGMPKVVQLQKEYPNVVYLFLSLDKTIQGWKSGIKKYHVKGEHYFIKSGWEGDFGSFVNIDWIPRYMLIDAQGKIALFKTVNANDPKIKDALEVKNL